MLAPTDSALGLPVIANRRVPQLVRHALNVEGGLNDGLALPFVTVFLALALEQEGAVGGGHVVQVFLRALLAFSLTVIRMVPVAVALLGSGLARPTVGYVGWFGPRGLASIVFADLVATSGLPEQHVIVPVVMLTVGLSVVLHGVTAPVGAQRYGSWYEAAVAHDPGIREAAEAPQPGQRVRVHGHPT